MSEQTNLENLEGILKKNNVIDEILKRMPELKLPNWYLTGGCISQTVWNQFHGFDHVSNIRDYDLVYFDTSDLSRESESYQSRKAREVFADLKIRIDLTNEARVHLWYQEPTGSPKRNVHTWYEEHFGHPRKPYSSVEESISSCGAATVTSIGVRHEEGNLISYSPFGLDNLFNLIVRPNKKETTKEIYMEKVERWTKIWPKLRVIPW